MPRHQFRKRAAKKKTKRMARKKWPISRGLGGVPEHASLTENLTINTQARPTYNCNQSYSLYNISLALALRAGFVSQAYQEYRIRRITLVWKAGLDTFAASQATVANNVLSTPHLYYMIDKKISVPNNFNLVTLQEMGAIPRRFDDKDVKVSYKPAVLVSSITDPTALTTQVAASQISPWLPTNVKPGDVTVTSSDVDHTGIVWYVHQPGTVVGLNTVPTPGSYDVEIMVDFEFRKPRLASTTTPNDQPALKVFA